MIAFGAILLAAAALVLALSLRGRVVARGRFCRGCGFDLAGLPDPAACPECGRDLALPRATRPIRRAPSRAGIAAAGVLLLIGGVITAVMLFSGPSVFAALPDGQVVLFNRLGVDGALDELAARASRTPPMSDAHWAVILERGLAHQADTETPWDPRWGEVLGRAFVDGRMTEVQTSRYLTHGFGFEVLVRDRVAPPGETLGYWVTFAQPRMSTSGAAGAIPTPLTAFRVIAAEGVVDHEASRRTGVARTLGPFEIPRAGGGTGSTSIGTTITIPPDAWKDGRTRIFIELAVQLQDQSGEVVAASEPHRVERPVRLLAPGEPVVRTITDTDAARAVRDAMKLSGLEITPPPPDGPAADPVTLGMIYADFDGVRPLGVAGRLFLLVDGEEVPFGPLSMPPGAGSHSTGLGWRVPGPESETAVRAARTLADRDAVDLIFRTDPTVAANDPRIDEVVDVTLVFRGVPINGGSEKTPAEGAATEEASPAGP